MKSSFSIDATLVANEFIDRYMASASGEYVKVYLYVQRHQREELEIGTIAEALNHTESDVRRALRYWVQMGVLLAEDGDAEPAVPGRAMPAGGIAAAPHGSAPAAPAPATSAFGTGAPHGGTPQATAARPTVPDRASYGQEQVSRLNGDEDFTQLLYIAQKYMNKIFTQRECEAFAYLYDGLRMTAELLEYLVEYCVQGGHSSIRYIEAVAQSWYEKGFRTVEEAKAYASSFSKDSFAVMRAFGLSERRPGDAEKEMITRWFDTYGFSREIVLEACNRALEATHSPSFRYADKILAEWKKAGVRTAGDIARLDEKHKSRAVQNRTEGPARRAVNQFHNFEQRNTDYDSIVMEELKSWIQEK